MPDHAGDTAESPTPQARAAAPDDAIRARARVWGGAGMGQWEGPNAAEVASFGTTVRVLVKWLGIPAGIGIAYVAHLLGMQGGGLVVMVLLGYPAVAVVAAFWGLRSRSRPRMGTLIVDRDRIQIEDEASPAAVELERIESFHVADSGRSSAMLTFHLRDGQSFFVQLAAADAPQVVGALDERLPSALSGTGLRPMLSRRRRDLPSWRAAMSALSTAGAYRGGAPPFERLLSAVRDARLSAEERIGAALALGAHGPERRRQLRIAARELDSLALRIAIEHVADETVDDAVIAGALDEEAAPRVPRGAPPPPRSPTTE
jgi:hypothetical protein